MAAGVRLQVGHRSAVLDDLLARSGTREAVLLTASNPRSRRMPQGWNARMMQRLRQCLRRRLVLQGESGTGPWLERQCLVLGAPAWGIHVARHFRQNAVLVVRRRQPVRLWVLP
jgi:hypothetical protein